MLGNRNKLKMGLLVVALLTSSLGFGAEALVLEKAHVDQFSAATQKFDQWARKLFAAKKIATFPALLKELDDDIVKSLADLKAQIPDVPPINTDFKTMIEDFCNALAKIHQHLVTAKSITQLKASAAGDCTFQAALEKAKIDLDELIKNANKKPETCSPDAIKALTEYRTKVFQKIYHDWHATQMSQLYAALVKFLPF